MPRTLWIHALGAKAGGGRTYLLAVMPRLFRLASERGLRVELLVPAAPPFSTPAHVNVRTLPRAAASHPRRLVFDQVILPLWLRRTPNAVLFCSGSFSPLTRSVPTVALLRNAIYFDERFLGRESPRRARSLRWQGRLITQGARACTQVHYPSDAMRNLVQGADSRLADRGRVIPYGVSKDYLAQARPPLSTQPLDGERFTFLYVMNYTLQKNLSYALEALAQARAAQLPVRLVVTSDLTNGPPACFERDRRLIEDHRLVESGYLVPAGRHFGDDLLALYRSADACLFPSFCESFGNPLIEAMALGKPLVCADLPYAHEQCGPQAAYVDLERPAALVDVWRRWADLGPSLPRLEPAQVAERYSWTRYAEALFAALLAAGQGQ